jgi:hypothetical protein
MTGDGDLLSGTDGIQQRRQMRFGLEGADAAHEPA